LSSVGAELAKAYNEIGGGVWLGFMLLLVLVICLVVSTSLWFVHALSHWKSPHLLGLALGTAVFVSIIPYMWLALESLWESTDGWQPLPGGGRRALAEVYAEERWQALQYAGELLPLAAIVSVLAAGTVLLYRRLGLDHVTFRRERRQLLRRMRKAGRRAART
jgi:hypothetical protein